MENKKSNESRRKLLKSIATGSGAVIAGKNLPENWARPVVESVLLPLHAQTSGAEITLSNCQITRVETIGTDEVEVDFSFNAQANPPTDLTILGTLDFELNFQPSNTTVAASGESNTDASGNGTFIMGTDSGTNSVIHPAGDNSVNLTIISFENVDEYTIAQCTTPLVSIPYNP